MKFNRKKFFDRYKKYFGSVKDYQVEGLEGLLWGFETYWGWWDSIDHIANALAQVKIESAHSFLPVVEGYYLAKGVSADKKYFQGDYDRVKRFQKTLRYYPFFGRGHIQLTWKTNYADQTRLIKKYFPEIVSELELNTGKNFDLVKNPELALDSKISFLVFTIGMIKGTFRRNLKLSDFDNRSGFDHYNARDIVNGDKKYIKSGTSVGNLVKKYALQFTDVLNYSLIKEDEKEDSVVDIVETSENEDDDSTPSSIEIETDDISVTEIVAEKPSTEPPKDMTAPAKENSESTATKMTIGGFIVPASIVAIFQAISSLVNQGFVSASDVGSVVIKFVMENSKYLFYLLIAIVILIMLKKTFKQLSFMLSMWINANPKMNDIKIIPNTEHKKVENLSWRKKLGKWIGG